MKNNVRRRRNLKAGVITSQKTLLGPYMVATSLVTKLKISESASNVAVLVTSGRNADQGGGITTLVTATIATIPATTTIREMAENTHPAPHAKRPTIPQTSATSKRSTIRLKLQLWQKLEQP